MGADVFVEAIINQHMELRAYAERLVADLNAADMVSQPVPGVVMNHPAWVMSHLAVYGPVLAGCLRGETPEDPLHHKYGRGSRPQADAGAYLEKDALMATLAAGYDEAIDALPAAQFGDAVPIERIRSRFSVIGELPTQFLLKHFATHLGQVSAWRRAGGRPAV